MAALLLCLLALVSAGMIAWGMRNPDRLYQYPTLAGATWLLFIVPQAFGVVRNPGKLPAEVVSAHGLEIALIMCILCATAGYLGYLRYSPIRIDTAACHAEFSFDRLFSASVAVYAAGFYGAWKLASLMGGFRRQFIGGEHYLTQWSGAPVKYSFLALAMYPALALALLATMVHPTMIRWCTIGVMAVYPLSLSVFLGRRSVAGFQVLATLLCFWFARRKALPRWLFLVLLVTAGIGVVLADQYRTRAQFGMRKDILEEVDAKGALSQQLMGKCYAEFDFLVVSATACHKALRFGYGTGFYNATIWQLVPAQIVGDRFKQQLFWRALPENLPEDVFGWTPPVGSDSTGPLTGFEEFWFLGCAIYYLMARVFAWLWHRASTENRGEFQCWYLLLCGMIPMSIYGSLRTIPGQVLGLMPFFLPLFWFVFRTPATRSRSLRRAVRLPALEAAAGGRAWRKRRARAGFSRKV